MLEVTGVRDITEGMDYNDACEVVVEQILGRDKLNVHMNWVIGDNLCKLERTHGRYDRVADRLKEEGEAKYDIKYLRALCYTAKRFETPTRVGKVAYSTYKAIADRASTKEEALKFLDVAETKGLSQHATEKYIKEYKQEKARVEDDFEPEPDGIVPTELLKAAMKVSLLLGEYRENLWESSEGKVSKELVREMIHNLFLDKLEGDIGAGEVSSSINVYKDCKLKNDIADGNERRAALKTIYKDDIALEKKLEEAKKLTKEGWR